MLLPLIFASEVAASGFPPRNVFRDMNHICQLDLLARMMHRYSGTVTASVEPWTGNTDNGARELRNFNHLGDLP